MHLGSSKYGGIKRFVGQVDRVIKKVVGIVYVLWHRMQRKAACGGIVHNVRWATAVSYVQLQSAQCDREDAITLERVQRKFRET